MSTARDIVTDALIELGVVAAGQAAESEDAALGLRKLNQLMQTWTNARLTFPTLVEISVPLDGSASYTIGPTGDVVAARPVKVLSATATLADVEYHVNVQTREVWDSITVKDVDGGPPCDVWYDAQSTNGRIYVYPQSTGYTLVLTCQTLLTSFANLSTTVTLPEGYETAMYLNLADRLAPAYGRQLSPDSRRMAAGAMRAVKRTNTEPMLLTTGLESGSEYRIERGY